ncbi:MAG: hypothetical protein ACKVUT_14750 [Gaiella sp.]
MNAGSEPASQAGAPDPEPAARLVDRVKGRPMLAVAAALGGVGTFIASIVAVAQLFVGGSPPAVAETLPETPAAAAAAYEFREVATDVGGRITVEVPTAWANVRRDGWHASGIPGFEDGALIGAGLNAAPNIDAWRRDLETPGVFIGASRTILRETTPAALLDGLAFDGCSHAGTKSYTNDRFTGSIVEWRCPRPGGALTRWFVVAATPTETRDFLVYIQQKLTSAADTEAYNKVLNTFAAEFP